MSTERDELTRLMMGRTAPRAADAVLAAGYRKPRQVATVEELDALPIEARIYSPSTGNVWWPRVGAKGPRWDGSGGMWTYTDEFLSKEGPFIRVDLHTPKEAPHV